MGPPEPGPAEPAEPTEPPATVASVTLKYASLAAVCVLSFLIRLYSVVRWESVIHEVGLGILLALAS